MADQLWLVTRIREEEEEVHQTNEPQDHEVFTVSWPLTLVFYGNFHVLGPRRTPCNSFKPDWSG